MNNPVQIPYDEMTWRQRSEAFLNDGRTMIGNAARQLQEATKPQLINGAVGPSPMAPMLLIQAQALAAMAQAYMTGGLICIQLSDGDTTTEPFDLRSLLRGSSEDSQESSPDEGMDKGPA